MTPDEAVSGAAWEAMEIIRRYQEQLDGKDPDPAQILNALGLAVKGLGHAAGVVADEVAQPGTIRGRGKREVEEFLQDVRDCAAGVLLFYSMLPGVKELEPPTTH